MKIRKIDIGEIEGFRLGNAENAEAGTGVTVIIAEEGAVGGVDVRGGGPATRETDLLRSENTVDKIHAVVLSGGSAFGLEAGSGVMRALAQKGIGFSIDADIHVPIVPGASLYDLSLGRSDVFPDVEMGKAAVENAFEGVFEPGNHGAGTGASVGKYLGYGRAMKTGLGTFACGDDYVQVGAIAAVNAVGDVYNGAGNIIAGLRTNDGSAIKGTIRVLKGMVHDESSPDLDLTDIKTIAAAEAVSRQAASAVALNEKSGDNSRAAVQAEEITTDEKDDIIKAMMRSYEQENSVKHEPESDVSEPESESGSAIASDHAAELPTDAPIVQPMQIQPASAAPEPAAYAESHAEVPASDFSHDEQDTAVSEYTEPEAAPEPAHESQVEHEVQTEPETDTADSIADMYLNLEDDSDQENLPEKINHSVDLAAEPVKAAETEPSAETTSESADYGSADAEPHENTEVDEYVLTEEDKADMGYDIPFNTTISCVITNAILTKNQANKLAQILHDAYARAIKPVHGTLDGDTIFVMSTCRQKVNFDAFAALATDVLQYAIIDGASSAESAYGLPAARDMIRK